MDPLERLTPEDRAFAVAHAERRIAFMAIPNTAIVKLMTGRAKITNLDPAKHRVAGATYDYPTQAIQMVIYGPDLKITDREIPVIWGEWEDV